MKNRTTSRTVFFSMIGAAAVLALLAARSTPPPVQLKVSGFKTNYVHHGSGFLESVDAVIQMTNSGTRAITFESSGKMPRYTTLRWTTNGWTESPFSFECSYSVKEYVLR